MASQDLHYRSSGPALLVADVAGEEGELGWWQRFRGAFLSPVQAAFILCHSYQESAFHKSNLYERNPARDRLESEVAGLETMAAAIRLGNR